jgi:hypothetical protein
VVGLHKIELIKARSPWRGFDESRSPPPNGSTGTATDGPSNTATTSYPSRPSRLTTLTTRPCNNVSPQTKVSGLAGAVQSGQTVEQRRWALWRGRVRAGSMTARFSRNVGAVRSLCSL